MYIWTFFYLIYYTDKRKSPLDCYIWLVFNRGNILTFIFLKGRKGSGGEGGDNNVLAATEFSTHIVAIFYLKRIDETPPEFLRKIPNFTKINLLLSLADTIRIVNRQPLVISSG